MQINIRTFGIAREICGGPYVQLEVAAGCTAAEVQGMLLDRFPRLGDLRSFLLAVNEEFAENDTPIAAGDDLALIPPVSGG